MLRKEMDAPKWAKSRTDRPEPTLEKLLTDKEDPKLT
jgi:hypothetical protein